MSKNKQKQGKKLRKKKGYTRGVIPMHEKVRKQK